MPDSRSIGAASPERDPKPFDPSVKPMMFAMSANLLLCLLPDLTGSGGSMGVANVVIPAVTLASGIINALRVVRKQPISLWSPIPWFLVACSLYFGLGALLPVLGGKESVEYANAFFFVDEYRLFRTNVLNTISTWTICVTYSAIRAARTSHSPSGPPTHSARQMVRLAWTFAAIGVPIKYLLMLPYNFGMLGFVVPGSINSLALLTSGVTFLLWYLAFKVSPRFLGVAVAFTFLELLSSVTLFAKLDLFLTLIMVFLGYYVAKPSRSALVFAGIALAAVYQLSTPFVTGARLALAVQHDQGYATRIAIALKYVSGGDQSRDVEPPFQAWWNRLNYTSSQSFAMELFDAGRQGDSFGLVSAMVVPRILWSDKPSMTPGPVFNYLATGNDRSSSAPGIFAEAYWNGGWLLVAATAVYVGAVFAWFTRMSVSHLSALDFSWLPCGIFGILMGLRIDDWFVATYVGSILVAIAYLSIIKIVFPGAPSARTARMPPPSRAV
jgi:hypothetical protein